MVNRTNIKIIMQEVIVGVDPGGSGMCISVNKDLEIIHRFPLPMKNIKGRKGKFVDEVKYKSEILNMLKTYNVLALYMEDPSLPEGKKDKQTIAKMFRTFGEQRGILIGMGISPNMVSPKKWQNLIHNKDLEIKKGNGKKDTKLTTLLTARRLCPTCKFTRTDRSKSDNHDTADAYCIAVYGWKTHVNK